MRLSNLKLKNFRNYHETKLEFSPNINVLIGENAQGKTNLLESIYVLAMTKSHRTTNDRELIEFSEKSAFLEGIVEKKTGNLRLSLQPSKTEMISIASKQSTFHHFVDSLLHLTQRSRSHKVLHIFFCFISKMLTASINV